jgi:hypothetical protein
VELHPYSLGGTQSAPTPRTANLARAPLRVGGSDIYVTCMLQYGAIVKYALAKAAV